MRLLVLRHGQASNAGASDAERPLTDSGRAAVAALAPVVEPLDPDLVLCSSALRTRQTLELLALDPGVDVRLEDGLYGAGVDELIEFVRLVDDDVVSVLIVGHNPAAKDLVVELTGGERIPSFRPATLAVLELDVTRWWEVAPATARLVSLHVPDPHAE
ncbi:MAG: phosphohistidine phosphatase [Frankiaceae bacterium]|nr:phosphohistidine phosphatase [Frankiaceae bacterium]